MTQIICCSLVNILINLCCFSNLEGLYSNFNLGIKNENNINCIDDDLTLKFEKAKAHLIWPVDQAKIVTYFGENQHPKYEKVRISHDGITLSFKKNSDVQCVFEGKVVRIERIPGLNYTIICRHGDYFTVYSNLTSVKLAIGDICKEKQVIGNVISVKNNDIDLWMYFQIWRKKDKLDPIEWLKERRN